MTGQETIDAITKDFRKAMKQEISVAGTDWPKKIVFPEGYFVRSATVYEDGSVDVQPRIPINWVALDYNIENCRFIRGDVDVKKYIAFLDEFKKLVEKYDVVVKTASQERKADVEIKTASQERKADVEISLPILTPEDDRFLSFKVTKRFLSFKVTKNKDKK